MKQILTAILLFIGFSTYAQQRPGLPADQKYEYFLHIDGVSAKADIAAVEGNMRGKPGVTFFESYQLTPKLFILRTSVPFTQQQVEILVNHAPYKLLEFVEDAKQKEELVKRLR